MDEQMLHEAVAVFPDSARVEAAADELMVNGFDRSFLSLMARSETVEHSPGLYSQPAGDQQALPRIAFIGCGSRREAQAAATAGLAYIGAVVAAGALVASGGGLGMEIGLAAAAGGAGGVIGAVLAHFIGAGHAQSLQDQIERGGILLWVRTSDAEAERKACKILTRHGGLNVRVYDVPLHEASREGGVSEELAWINKPVGEVFGPSAGARSRAGVAARRARGNVLGPPAGAGARARNMTLAQLTAPADEYTLVE